MVNCMKSVAFHNLGCKVNAYEIEVMQQMLQEKGYQVVPFDTKADIYIINTCTVTNIADRKSRQMLHRVKKLNPDSIVVAVGCYVQTDSETVEKDLAVDIAVGNNRKTQLPEILEEYLQRHELSGGIESTEPEGHQADMNILDINHTDVYEDMQLTQTAEHTRAYIKVQDGCNQFCTYCIIPFARGRVRSRSVENICKEVGTLAEKGYREIVVTGIHLSSYGLDFDGVSYEFAAKEWNTSHLLELLQAIHAIPGVERIRLGSLEPRIITEEFADALVSMEKICPHFHLSLQSGCDSVLQRMNRHYSAGEYLEKVELLRRKFEHPAITTDVIVGFPGETAEEFEITRNFLEQICLFEMHIFKYSRRKGTKAADMPGQLTEHEKAVRSEVLLEMETRQSKNFRSFYLGKEVEVLLEEEKEIDGQRYQIGHTKEYVKVAVPAGGIARSNQIWRGVPEGFLTNEILIAH